jgi:hypothetical protein
LSNPRKSKLKSEVYVNQDRSLSDLQTLIKHSFLLYFLRELLMRFLIYILIALSFLLCSLPKNKVYAIWFIFFRERIFCDSVKYSGLLVAPSYEEKTKICHLQQQPLLYSCVSSSTSHMRLCPCRDYIKDQVALCKDCWWSGMEMRMDYNSCSNSMDL